MASEGQRRCSRTPARPLLEFSARRRGLPGRQLRRWQTPPPTRSTAHLPGYQGRHNVEGDIWHRQHQGERSRLLHCWRWIGCRGSNGGRETYPEIFKAKAGRSAGSGLHRCGDVMADETTRDRVGSAAMVGARPVGPTMHDGDYGPDSARRGRSVNACRDCAFPAGRVNAGRNVRGMATNR